MALDVECAVCTGAVVSAELELRSDPAGWRR